MSLTVFKRLSALERRRAPVNDDPPRPKDSKLADEFEEAVKRLPVAELVALAEAIEADLLGVPVGDALTGLADAAWQKLEAAIGAERLHQLFEE
jgi:hypothetical protein